DPRAAGAGEEAAGGAALRPARLRAGPAVYREGGQRAPGPPQSRPRCPAALSRGLRPAAAPQRRPGILARRGAMVMKISGNRVCRRPRSGLRHTLFPGYFKLHWLFEIVDALAHHPAAAALDAVQSAAAVFKLKPAAGRAAEELAGRRHGGLAAG